VDGDELIFYKKQIEVGEAVSSKKKDGGRIE